jgi:hypothetical protein
MDIIESEKTLPGSKKWNRILIAIHRHRFRGTWPQAKILAFSGVWRLAKKARTRTANPGSMAATVMKQKQEMDNCVL